MEVIYVTNLVEKMSRKLKLILVMVVSAAYTFRLRLPCESTIS